MRKLFAVIAAGAFMLVGVSANAAQVQTTATLQISLGSAGGFTLTETANVTITGSGSTITANGGTVAGSQLLVPSGFITVPNEIVISVPSSASTLIGNVILRTDLQNGAGAFSAGGGDFGACPGGGAACVSGGGVGGVMPILGNVAITIPGLATGDIDLGALNIGQGGGGTAVIDLGLLALTAVANAAPWTTGSGQVVTTNGTPVSAGASSPLTLVSPTYVDASLLELAAFASVSFSGINVVPEPSTLLLLGAGVAGLAFVGRSRRS